jgi:hypothetical protein
MTKTIVTILGVVFVLIGIWGFVSEPILGLFEVNVLHNVVHILSGVLALWAVSKGAEAITLFSKVFGVVYGLVAVLGFVAPALMMDLLAVNMADNILHVILAVVFLVIGFAGNKVGGSSAPAPTPMA